MVQVNLKWIVISYIFAFSALAYAEQDKESLAHQCYVISQKVSSLIANQQNANCIEKLHTASLEMGATGFLILNENREKAKKIIEAAVIALQFAELNGCNSYIEISHSKHEVHRLKQLL